MEQHPETVAEEVEIKRLEHEQWLDYREISEGFSGGRLDGLMVDGLIAKMPRVLFYVLQWMWLAILLVVHLFHLAWSDLTW